MNARCLIIRTQWTVVVMCLGDVLLKVAICTVQDCDFLGNEIMAILSLSSGEEDLQHRLSRLIVATNKSGDPVTTEDLVSMCVYCIVCVCLCDLICHCRM